MCNEELTDARWHEVQVNTPRALFAEIEKNASLGKTKFVLNRCNSEIIWE